MAVSGQSTLLTALITGPKPVLSSRIHKDAHRVKQPGLLQANGPLEATKSQSLSNSARWWAQDPSVACPSDLLRVRNQDDFQVKYPDFSMLAGKQQQNQTKNMAGHCSLCPGRGALLVTTWPPRRETSRHKNVPLP